MDTDVVTRDHVKVRFSGGILKGGEGVNGVGAVSSIKWGVERDHLVHEERRRFVRKP